MKSETKTIKTTFNGQNAYMEITRYSDGDYICESYYYEVCDDGFINYQGTGLCAAVTQEEMAKLWESDISDSSAPNINNNTLTTKEIFVAYSGYALC